MKVDCLLILAALQAGAAASQPLLADDLALVNGNRVNVRGQPSLDSEILWQLAKGETVSVRDEIPAGKTGDSSPPKWARIALPAKMPVWVRSSFVSNGAVTASQLNVRSGPGEKFVSLALLPRGTKVSALAEKSGWLQIKPPADAASYVAADFLLPQKSAPAAPASAKPNASAVAANPAPAPGRVVSVVALLPTDRLLAESAPTLPSAAEPVAESLLKSPPSTPLSNQVATAPESLKQGLNQPAKVRGKNPIPETFQNSALPVFLQPEPAQTTEPPTGTFIAPAIQPDKPIATVGSETPSQTGPDDTIPVLLRLENSTPRSALSAGLGSSGAGLLAVSRGSFVGLAAQSPSALPSVVASGRDPRPVPALVREPGENLNRFGVSYRVGYHMTASISRMAPFMSAAELGLSTAPGVSRVYDDGFVRVDSSGNAEKLTWNWGYSEPEQVSTADSVELHSFSGNFSSEAQRLGGDAPQHGFEVTYNRQVSNLGGKYDNGTWGFLVGFSRTDFSVHDSQSLAATLNTTTDIYPLGGVIPPLAPYQGSFQGPGPLISSVPERGFSSFANGASIIGQRSFEADIYGLRIGPYVEIPIGRYLSVSLNFGVAVGVVDSELRYSNTLVIPGSSVRLSQTGRSSDNGVVPGWYYGLNVNVPIYRSLSVTGGFQFEGFDRYTHNSGSDRVELNMFDARFFKVGLAYSF
jgi:SH3-like domain-containing protein